MRPLPRTVLVLPVCPCLLMACQVGDAYPRGQGSAADPDSCEPSLPGQDPEIFEACCQDYGGGAHCVPDGLVPADMHEFLGACAGGGLCVPDPFIENGGAPECLPDVDNLLLGQDGCAEGYKCAPCLDPLSGEPTGACDYLALP